MGTVVTSGSTLYFVTGSIDEDGSNITTNAIAAKWEVDPADNTSVQLRIPKEMLGTENDRIAFYMSGSGRVGIGTKDPQAAFDVRDTAEKDADSDYDTEARESKESLFKIDRTSGFTEVTASGNVSASGNIYATDYFDNNTNINTIYSSLASQKQITHHMILDDIDSDVVYISLMESDAENTSHSNKHLPLIAPGNGKLLKIFLRTSVDQSGETFTWKLYTRSTSVTTNGAASEIGAQSGTGPNASTMVTYDFTTGVTGTNAINVGDKVQISLEAADGATANGNYFITCLWEWDLS